MRLRAYEDKVKGSMSAYETFWRAQLSEVKAKFATLKRPTQPVKSQMIDRIRDIQTQALQALSHPQARGSAPSKSVSALRECMTAMARAFQSGLDGWHLFFSPFHYGRKQPRIQTVVLGHSLVRSLVRSHRSLVRLLRTVRFARALRCAHSLARSLTSLTPSLVGQ